MIWKYLTSTNSSFGQMLLAYKTVLDSNHSLRKRNLIFHYIIFLVASCFTISLLLV